jgi:antitoxin (DNA-binding transcriptional repressor) of toxin-antitoxin stability system
MKIAGVRDMKQRLSAYLREVRHTPVIITKNGRPCAALVELTNAMDLEAFLCAHNPRLMAMIDRNASSRQEIPFQAVEALVKRNRRDSDRKRHPSPSSEERSSSERMAH